MLTSGVWHEGHVARAAKSLARTAGVLSDARDATKEVSGDATHVPFERLCEN